MARVNSPELSVPRPVGISTWFWVPVVLVLTAGASALAGVVAGALVVSAAVAAAVGRHGELLFGTRRHRVISLAALAISVVVLFGVLLQGGVPWLRTSSTGTPDLTGRVLTQDQVAAGARPGEQLSGSVLAGLDLRGRTLDGVRAPGASFRGADLSGVSLRGADLRGADLRDACLVGADLAGARLAGAMVTGTGFGITPTFSEPVVGTPLPAGARASGCR